MAEIPSVTGTVFEVELVELHSGDQVAECVWFKGGHVRVTQFPVGNETRRGPFISFFLFIIAIIHSD